MKISISPEVGEVNNTVISQALRVSVSVQEASSWLIMTEPHGPLHRLRAWVCSTELPAGGGFTRPEKET